MKKVVPKDAVLIPQQAKRVFAGQIFDVYQWPQKMFDGSTATFEMLKRPDTVIAICIIDDQILVIDYEQPNVGERIAFPAGRVDESDSSTLTAIQREVEEETGHQFNNWRLVYVYQPYVKLEWFVYFYLALDGQKTTEPRLDSGERITVRLVDFDKVKGLVYSGAGFLKQSKEVFENVNSLAELKNLPEFDGQEVDR
ncbi:MAG: NUDIX hydrolase [Candidatus Saccharibacteria bacterium GW2011_GWA2_46_10]|nr:MAG: NUDIX hydrolase [Candidatus Saccharibacteria bacterium GW2011_GWA2_46_10]OGL35016.1 MAG: hypothetical protein A3F05_01640 [Candidatus Saccharibacteria bacterium RIFCSPHIGHO2_12_FULL_47_17]OGL37929.1 MAG: hypothetical protein A3J32_00695 [Candidatus Saccharibacteria bacterium RIFCSPLOWO2_02_FULL_46_7]